MKTIKDLLKKIAESRFVQSKKHEKILKALIYIVVALIILQFGVIIGYKKANFSSAMGDNYYRAFDMKGFDNGARGRVGTGGKMDGGSRDGIEDKAFDKLNVQIPGPLPGGHGTVGKIIKIELPIITVEGPDGVEKFVRIDDQTMLKKFRDRVSQKDLTTKDYVIVLGEPNSNAEIQARLIRVLPPPPDDIQPDSIQPMPTNNSIQN